MKYNLYWLDIEDKSPICPICGNSIIKTGKQVSFINKVYDPCLIWECSNCKIKYAQFGHINLVEKFSYRNDIESATYISVKYLDVNNGYVSGAKIKEQEYEEKRKAMAKTRFQALQQRKIEDEQREYAT